ncbi:hypothetical protein Aduo_016858 [Ancylostoma duodenale]
MLRIILLLSIAAVSHGRLKQCKCVDIEPCTNIDSRTVLGCADQCQSHASRTGASYPALRQCYQEMEGTLNAVIKCVKNQLSNTCSRSGNPLTVRNFHPELFKLALLKEINDQLKRSGIKHDVVRFFRDDKAYSECQLKCMNDRVMKCFKDKKCGLNLPSNEALVSTLKQCALSSGMGTDGFRKLCRCGVKAGARGLAQVCEKIVIS